MKAVAANMGMRHVRARSIAGMGNRIPPSNLHIVDIVQQLASCEAAHDVVRVVAASTRCYVGAEGATVVMRHGNRARYLEEDAIGALWKGRDFAADDCISGWAMEHGQQVVVPDIREDPRIVQPLYAATFVRSLVMTPIECAGEVVGALGAYWSEPRTPSRDECTALDAIASSAALALVNVRLLAEIRQDDLRRQRFLDGLVNELGALIGPLRTSLHAQRHATDDAARRRAGEVITRQLAGHARLIEHLRDGSEMLSGKDGSSFWPIDLAGPITHAIAARREAAQAAEVQLVFDSSGTPLPVSGDERRLAQAIGHVLDNSLRFTPPGGRVTVSAAVLGGSVVVTIEDTGVGIADHVLPHLFEPFYQPEQEPESSVSGLGLGLSLVASITRAHGGTATIRSPGAGKGACVTLQIPLLDLREQAPRHARSTRSSAG